MWLVFGAWRGIYCTRLLYFVGMHDRTLHTNTSYIICGCNNAKQVL